MSKLSTEVHNVYNGIATALLPRANEVNDHIKDFLLQEKRDFQGINARNDQILDQLKSEWDQYSKLLNDIKNKKTKDNKFLEGGSGYLKAKDTQITGKKKVLDSISTGLKESVTKIKPEKLAALPYEKEPILKEVFSTLYHVLYNEPINTFDWKLFKEKALILNDGEDFITRMANVNFKQLSEEHHDALLRLKSDEKFKDVCENSIFAFDIVDVADWIDYTVEGYKVNEEKKNCEHDYDKIKKDLEKRKDGTGQLKEEFCTEAMKEFDHYQNNLMALQGQLRNITIDLNSSINELEEIETKRNHAIEKINAI